MSNNILLSTTQADIMSAYKFKNTNIKVYSFEEAIYHCYHYFKQSVEDFTSSEFILWVSDTLGQTIISAQIKNILKIESFSQRLLKFLTLIDYFSEEQLEILKKDLTLWENTLEWERIKEHADYLLKNNDMEKAIPLYIKAMQYSENIYLFNNLAIAYMKQGKFEEAYEVFGKAYLIEKNIDILINYCESSIYSRNFSKATLLIEEIQEMGVFTDIYYLKGLLELESNNYNNSILYFTKGFEKTKEDYYLYKIADVYCKKRNYEKAITILEDVSEKDTNYLFKLAEIQVSNLNVPAAVKCMQRAIMNDKENINIWTSLAKYHRLNYDLVKASSSISKALSLDPNNELAQMENARIKKSQGKIKEYQNILHSILDRFKRKYRELF